MAFHYYIRVCVYYKEGGSVSIYIVSSFVFISKKQGRLPLVCRAYSDFIRGIGRPEFVAFQKICGLEKEGIAGVPKTLETNSSDFRNKRGQQYLYDNGYNNAGCAAGG